MPCTRRAFAHAGVVCTRHMQRVCDPVLLGGAEKRQRRRWQKEQHALHGNGTMQQDDPNPWVFDLLYDINAVDEEEKLRTMARATEWHLEQFGQPAGLSSGGRPQ
eukprot:6831261-Prymnesium_polylepis.1